MITPYFPKTSAKQRHYLHRNYREKAGQNVSPVIYIDNLFRENITEPEIKEISNALYNDFMRAEKEKLIDLSDFSA